MGLHFVVYEGAIYNSTAFQQIDAVQTEFETVNNNGFLIGPENLVIGGTYYSAHGTRLRLQAPSLQVPDYPDLRAIMNARPSSSVKQRWDDFRAAPISLKQMESLLAYGVDDNSTTENSYVGIYLCDKVPAPVAPTGRWIHGTGSTTLTANAFTTCLISLDDQLPAGSYDVLAMRVQGASPVFARLALPGLGYRPGVPCVLDDLTDLPSPFNPGELGVLASFLNTTQISVEVFATAADTAQSVYFYVNGPK